MLKQSTKRTKCLYACSVSYSIIFIHSIHKKLFQNNNKDIIFNFCHSQLSVQITCKRSIHFCKTLTLVFKYILKHI